MSNQGSTTRLSAPQLALDFLKSLFGNDWPQAHVCIIPGDPYDDSQSWAGGRAGGLVKHMRPDTNNYFSVSLFKDQFRRRASFERLMCVVIDDVGPKIEPVDVELLLGPPTWKTETSPGNFQWGYKLATPIEDEPTAKELIHRIRVILAGEEKDPGQESSTRYMRLPCGSNRKDTRPGKTKTPVEVKAWGYDEKILLSDDAVAAIIPLVPGQGGEGEEELGDQALDPAQDLDRMLEELENGANAGLPLVHNSKHAGNSDPVLSALKKLGLVLGGPRTTAMGWGWDIICPWADDHTDRSETGTLYVADAGKFKCHHGHCENRTLKDLLPKLDELLKDVGYDSGLIGEEFEEVDPETVEVTTPETAIEREFFARYVLMVDRDRFWDVNFEREVTPLNVNARWTRKLMRVLPRRKSPGAKTGQPKPITPVQWFMEDTKRGRQAMGMIGWPGKPRVFAPDPKKDAQLFVNTWTEMSRPLKAAGAAEVDAAAIAPWLELFWHVAGQGTQWHKEIGEIVLDWLALSLGDPGTKAGWHVVLMGQPGLGKDTLLLPAMQALGQKWARTIQSQQFESGFNEWAGARLVQISETKQNTRGSMTGHDQMNLLKGLLDHTREWIDINPKYAAKYTTRNVVMCWFTSNEREPLRIETGDRRFLILDRNATAPLPRKSYQKLHDWLKSGGAERVAEYLIRRWETMSDARKQVLLSTAPDTPDKHELLDRLIDPIEEWMRQCIAMPFPANPLSFPDVVHAAYVQGRLDIAIKTGGEGLPSGVGVPRTNTIGAMLRKAGAVELNQGKPVKLNGWPVTFLAVRDADAYIKLRPADLARVFTQSVGGAHNMTVN